MRRMRDLTIGHYVAAAVPVLAAGFGIYYMVRHHNPLLKGKETVVIEGSKKGARKIAAAKEHERIRSLGAGDRQDEGMFDSDKTGKGEAGEKTKETPRGRRTPSSDLEATSNDAASVGRECDAIEYRGAGPQATKVTKGEWTAVMSHFHGAKNSILALIEKRRHDLADGTAQALEHQIRNLKIQRPPASDEPDLSWRGIGIFTQNSEGEPMVKLGGGFVHLVTKHPARARFEMARLVAQSLAPCELQRIGASEATWTPLLTCLGMTESQGCGQGTYSENGWAVSTAIASAVSAPGCQIPAFKSSELAQCAKRIPLGKETAQVENAPARNIASAALDTAALEGVKQ